MRKYKGFWLAYVIVSLKEGACLLSLVIFSVREGTKERGGEGREKRGRLNVPLHFQSQERRERVPGAKAFTTVNALLLSVQPAG